MKKTRRFGRELALQSIYQIDFWEMMDIGPVLDFSWNDKEAAPEILIYARSMVEGVFQHREEINRLLRHHTPIDRGRVAKIDLSILRLSIYELQYTETDYKIVINEALELCRSYSEETSVRFINGVLDAVWTNGNTSP